MRQTKTIAMVSNVPKAELQRGLALKHQHDLHGAREHFQGLLLRYPENPQVLMELGLISAENGQAEHATSFFARAVAKAPR
jgi:Flp pilus assembly protein TadD